MASNVELYASKIVPFEHGVLEGGGEFIQWDVDSMMQAVVEGFQLSDSWKQRSVELNLAIDGAQLSKRVNHVTCGIKVIDKAAVSPFTGQPIFASANEATLQSRHLCFPLMIITKRETKEIYPVFKGVFDRIDRYGNEREVQSLLGDGVKPLKVAMNGDMSAHWKLLGVGGAAKRDKRPCHCCAIQSEDLHLQNPDLCNRWCMQLHSERPGWKCYHQKMFTDESIAEMEQQATKVAGVIASLIPDMDRLLANSKIKTDEDPRAPLNQTSLSDIQSIHFDLGNKDNLTRKNKTDYSLNLMNDLLLRKLNANDGSLRERQQRLRESLVQEWTYRQLQQAISHSNKGKDSALVLLLNAVPCILHLENRVGLKIMTVLLQEGLGNAVAGNSFAIDDDGGDVNSVTRRTTAFFHKIERICNTDIWGSADNPSHWECPRDDSKNEIGIICLDNNRTRAVVNNIEDLVDVCIIHPEKKDQWKHCLRNYRCAIEILRKKEEFSDGNIAAFQCKVDLFFQDWVKLLGIAGMTNYVHMLCSGHISDYLFRWRNLYAHSQQGWEAFNALLKTFYFRRTCRGGAGNKGTSLKSKVLPVAKWLSRRIIWMCGVTYDRIESSIKKKSATDAADDDNDDNNVEHEYEGNFIHDDPGEL